MWTVQYWKDLGERVVTSAAGGALTALGGDHIFNAWSADWGLVGGFALGAAAVSVFKGLAAKAIGNSQSASLNPDA